MSKVKWTGSTTRPDILSFFACAPGSDEQTEFPIDTTIEVTEEFALLLAPRTDFVNVDFDVIDVTEGHAAITQASDGSSDLGLGAVRWPQAVISGGSTTPVPVPQLPEGTVGVPYQVTIGFVGGSGPVTMAIITGALPAGLTLETIGETTTWQIDGTPSEEADVSIEVEVTDVHGHSGSAMLQVVIAAAP